MSDDLVKRYTTYNVMMSKESGKYISSPDGKWVLFTDHADRIEELEAKLAKAAEALARAETAEAQVDQIEGYMHQAIWALEPFARLAAHHAAEAPEMRGGE